MSYERLVSPNAFDGRGPVPDKVMQAARRIAQLRVKFVNQWAPGIENPLTIHEVEELFNATAVQAEWMRELYEALHGDVTVGSGSQPPETPQSGRKL